MDDKLLKVYTDGGARGNPGPGACAFVVMSEGKVKFKNSKYLGKRTNNEAEYEALIFALEWIFQISEQEKPLKINFYLDSELVVKQVNGLYRVKDLDLQKLFSKVRDLNNKLSGEISYFSIAREKNRLADRMVNDVLDEKMGGFTSEEIVK